MRHSAKNSAKVRINLLKTNKNADNYCFLGKMWIFVMFSLVVSAKTLNFAIKMPMTGKMGLPCRRGISTGARK